MISTDPSATSPSGSRHFILAICGPPGAGKTTLIAALRRQIDPVATVFYDDFQSVTAQSQADMSAWFERGADPNAFPLTELIAALRRVSEKPEHDRRRVVLFETPFGRHHRGTGDLIDLLVWIDVPLDIAFARQVNAFCKLELTSKGSNPRDFIRWLEGYASVYCAALRAAYVKQRTEIGAAADAIIDGTAAIAASAERVAALVHAAGVTSR